MLSACTYREAKLTKVPLTAQARMAYARATPSQSMSADRACRSATPVPPARSHFPDNKHAILRAPPRSTTIRTVTRARAAQPTQSAQADRTRTASATPERSNSRFPDCSFVCLAPLARATLTQEPANALYVPLDKLQAGYASLKPHAPPLSTTMAPATLA